MKKTIEDYNLENKRVIIRVDFNVPIKDGIIKDDNRIKESLKTIKYAINHNAKVILLSHLGKVKTEEDKIKNNLKPVAQRLSELLNQKVIFIEETRGDKLTNSVNSLNPQEVLLVQNTRYEDLENKYESSNDENLASYWASLGDIFINDAFGSSHRAHASLVGIASKLPNGIGFLVEKELKELEKVTNVKERPFTVIMGGAKIEDKIGVIESLVSKCDHILIGTGMAFTFLKAKSINVGKSIVDNENIDFCKKMLQKYPDKIVLPVDVYAVEEIGEKPVVEELESINENQIGVDIGPLTLELFNKYLKESKTIFWNGPVGIFENEMYANGTIGICQTLKKLDCTKIAGGGDTGSAINNFGFKDYLTHISTGGGAALELVEGKELPGIKVIEDRG